MSQIAVAALVVPPILPEKGFTGVIPKPEPPWGGSWLMWGLPTSVAKKNTFHMWHLYPVASICSLPSHIRPEFAAHAQNGVAL